MLSISAEAGEHGLRIASRLLQRWSVKSCKASRAEPNSVRGSGRGAIPLGQSQSVSDLIRGPPAAGKSTHIHSEDSHLLSLIRASTQCGSDMFATGMVPHATPERGCEIVCDTMPSSRPSAVTTGDPDVPDSMPSANNATLLPANCPGIPNRVTLPASHSRLWVKMKTEQDSPISS
jgi:hypothetical protein